MRVSITRSEIVEVSRITDEVEGFGERDITAEDLDDLRDSLQDDILNSQDSGHETNDGKFSYVPQELSGFVVELVGDEETPA